MSRRLRILVLTPEYPQCGGDVEGRFIHDQVRALADRGHGVRVAVPTPRIPPIVDRLDADWVRKRRRPRRYRYDGIEVLTPRFWMPPAYMLFQHAGRLCERGVAGTVTRLHREEPFDVVHAHMFIVADGAIRIGRRLGVPVVWTVHGQEDPRAVESSVAKRSTLRRIVAAMDRIVVVGEPLRPYVLRLGADEARVRVVHNGVDLPDGPWADGARPISGPRVLLSVSGLRPEKGLEDNLRAVRLLVDRGYDVRYRVVGDGTERANLAGLAERLGIADRVHFDGWVDRGRLAEVLSGCDVFSVPSRLEGFGLAHAEAMLAGRPVVAGRGTGPEAFIADGRNGVLVPQGDPEALAEGVAWLFDHPDLARQMGLEGRARIRAEYTWARSAQRLESVYRELLDGAR